MTAHERPGTDRNRDSTSHSDTPHAEAGPRDGSDQRRFVIQRHDARNLHFDVRLEIDGVLVSWAGYGAGTVIVWDPGTYDDLTWSTVNR